MRRILNALFLFLFLSNFSSAQQKSLIDSLPQILPNLDLQEKWALNQRLSEIESNLPLPQKISFQKKLIEQASQVQDTFFLRNAYARLSSLYLTQGDTLTAQKWRQQQREMAIAYGWIIDHPYFSLLAYYNMHYTDIRNSLSILKEQKDRLTIEEVTSEDFSDRWTANTYTETDIDSESVFWVKLKVKNVEDEHKQQLFSVCCGIRSWEQIDLFISDKEEDWIHQRIGLDLAADRPLKDAFNVFYVDVPPRDERTVILRLANPNSAYPLRFVGLRAIRSDSLSELEGYRSLRVWPSKTYMGYHYQGIKRSLEIVVDTFGGYDLPKVKKVWDQQSRYNDWESFQEGEYTYWVKLRLLGSAGQAGLLLFRIEDIPHFWREANIYIPDKQGNYQQLKSGHQRWSHNKTIADPDNLFQVSLTDKDTIDVFLQLKPWGNNPTGNHFSLQEIQPNFFWTQKTSEYYPWGILSGMILLQALFFLVLFLVVREHLHLYYFAFLAGLFACFLLSPNPWLPQFPDKIQLIIVLVGTTLSIWSFLKYEEVFLNVSRHIPKLSKYVKMLTWSLLLTGASMVISIILFYSNSNTDLIDLNNPLALIWFLVVFSTLTLILVINVQSLRRGVPMARYFLATNVILILSTLSISFFILLDLVGDWLNIEFEQISQQENFSFLLSLIFITGLLLALILLAAGIGLRTNQLKKEKETALQQQLTGEQAVNKRLRQVDQLKDQFLANTSHELRTPLNGIIGLSESLLERVDKQEQQQDLNMIISSGKRLASLVNDILDFSRLRNQEIQLRLKPVDLRVLVDVVIRINQPLIRNKDLLLENTISPGLPSVLADEDRLQQILFNLIGNAIKFTESGRVWISAEEKEGQMVISVADTGIGIPENKQNTIFQAFEQADGSIQRQFAGTGLGLSISKRLCEQHGGQMWVESEVGQGATFFFTLPISSEKISALDTNSQLTHRTFKPHEVQREKQLGVTKKFDDTINSPFRGNEPCILVVDDEPINQQVLKNHLSGLNIQLIQAMNGEEAIEAIEKNTHFDLILLDVMMPRMSGYEVCSKIREKYLPSELPIIMITAKNQLQDIVQGLSLGANDYLPKPFQKEELLARIKTQLDLHQIFSVAGRFVPNEFLRVLNRERITEVTLGDFAEREVTVLFTDIRDYTTLSESMTPEENFKFVNAFHGRMGPIIQKHQGFVNQFLGDAIMAIFVGAPKNAVLAAIEMQHSLMTYNQERQADGRQAVKMGVGLHTGDLIMGVIGDRNRMDAATIADTVNTASRIEGLTKHYGASILLSEDSYRQLNQQHGFRFRRLGKVQVKGKKEPLGLYECYDGDLPELVELKTNTAAIFEKGLELYFEREFPQAAATFDTVLKMNPNDSPAQFFLNRSSGFILNGVPDDWSGVEIMTFK